MPARGAPQPAGAFARLRHGVHKPGVFRLVFDFTSPVDVSSSRLVPHGRDFHLLVDVTYSPSAPSAIQPAGPVIGATGLAVGNAAVPAGATDGVSLANTTVSGPAATRATGISKPGALSAPQPRPASRGLTASPQWVITIDPGHGGDDPGAIGPSGIYEKMITLAEARALRDELKALGRYKVVFTRTGDTYVPLRQRIAIARAAGANLFVSLHADKTQNASVRGLSVYTLSQRASDTEAAALAEKENRADLIGGVSLSDEPPDVTNILIDLVQRDTMNESARFAALLVSELGNETAVLPKAHRFAGFAVLKSPDVPSVLIELGYLSNPTEEKLLRSPKHRRALANAIARAIDGYFVRFEARNRL
ncbi:MAG: N-acetylmuramoyl-L-alanine amidase [Rhodospirillales bacterium]|nr:N-acetylmuramoyl-L-alanine amidase [Rhodospirillales bacterium]